MASYTADDAKHATLTGSTVDTVTLKSGGAVRVINVDGTSEIYFTINGTAPTVAGDNTYVVPAVKGASETVRRFGGKRDIVVKLISGATPKYCVRAERG